MSSQDTPGEQQAKAIVKLLVMAEAAIATISFGAMYLLSLGVEAIFNISFPYWWVIALLLSLVFPVYIITIRLLSE